MKIGIASHVVIDTIQRLDGRVIESIGGPSCYCGITSAKFGFNVALATKVGKDFPKEMYEVLQSNNIKLGDKQFTDAPTTRFRIFLEGDSRQLTLNVKCKPVTADDIKGMDVDCWLASPVFDEVPPTVLAAIKKNKGKKNFIMLDPQGYLRLVDQKGRITYRNKLQLDLTGITAIKVDPQEMQALTGGLTGLEGMRFLQAHGIDLVISTEYRIFHLLHGDTHYWINMPDVNSIDSTGMGDILCASFSCAFIKEKDPMWAICFGAGAVRAALETGQIGLDKIPSISKIEHNASYFYNTMGFQNLS
ncbi:MAG: PfkB family carbohydrate kinase [Thermoproteota archaeon]|nr:PfkB family carbohydrate kinase [Thermoproteota archaeon]